MMLTTKARYAVMALVDMVTYGQNTPMTLQEIAARQQIPLNYLEQIFAKLRRKGLVTALRGPGGGYHLSQTPETTWIAEIILAVEEPIKITRCSSKPSDGCMHDKTRCLTHDLWEGLGNVIYDYLCAISLSDVCKGTLPKSPLHPHLADFSAEVMV